MKHTTLFLLLLILSPATYAQFAVRTFEIDSNRYTNTNPHSYTIFKNKVYFIATDTAHGTELWVCDGNSVNIVADILPGLQSSIANGITTPQLCVASGKLYFRALDANLNTSIYEYDGLNTPAVITNADSGYIDPFNVVPANGDLYYIADSIIAGNKKKVLVKYSPATRTNNVVHTFSYDQGFASFYIEGVNDKLCYYGISPQNDTGFIVYEPVANTYNKLTDINGNDVGLSRNRVYNDKLYFESNSSTGRQYYEYDGYSTITPLTYDAATHTSYTFSSLHYKPFTIADGKFYFFGIIGVNGGLISYSFNTKKHINELKSVSGGSLISNGRTLFTSYANKTLTYDTKTAQQSFLDTSLHFELANRTDYVVLNGWIYATILGDNINNRVGILYDSSLSVNHIHARAQIATILYPNPTTSDAQLEFTLDVPQKLSLRVTDISGRVVYEQQPELYLSGTNTISLPTALLPTGEYIYSLSESGTATIISSGLLNKL